MRCPECGARVFKNPIDNWIYCTNCNTCWHPCTDVSVFTSQPERKQISVLVDGNEVHDTLTATTFPTEGRIAVEDVLNNEEER